MTKLASFLKKRRNGGFTLVEMIISIALLAVLLGGMMIMVAPILDSFNSTKKHLVAENVSTTLQNYITLRMKNATNVYIFANTNETSVNSNGATEINKLKNFCKTKTSANKNAYNMHCISLRYDTTDGRYYLYTETPDVDSTTSAFSPSTRKAAFTESFYNDLYYTVDINKALDMDKASETPQPRLPDTIELAINTYDDAAQKNLVFSGYGLTEFREIGREIVRKNTSAQYALKIFTGESAAEADGFSMADAVDDTTRDIFIFYTTYNFAAGK